MEMEKPIKNIKIGKPLKRKESEKPEKPKKCQCGCKEAMIIVCIASIVILAIILPIVLLSGDKDISKVNFLSSPFEDDLNITLSDSVT